jgi:serine/threonine protein kinase
MQGRFVSLSLSLNPGDSLYKYQLTRKIGGGNFGEVWLAHDLAISRDVAVKILDESMAPVAENLKEAQLGHRLEHQNVVHVHYADVVQVNGTNVVLIAMDFHPSGSVIGQLNPSNFLSISQSIRVVIDILRGLEYLHEQSLYHNDIKPSNILLGPRGEGVLTDYGISCLSNDLQPAPAPNAYVLHRAPETGVHNNISVQTDIYQVGLTLFRLISGVGLVRDLRDAVGQVKFEQLKAQDKVPRKKDYLPFVPASIRRIITKATRSDPSGRYQSALEMRRALEKVALHGDWTSDSTGSYLGHFNNQLFRFECHKTPKGFTFIPYRKRIDSGKETRIGRLSASRLSASECENAVTSFMLTVVNGEI